MKSLIMPHTVATPKTCRSRRRLEWYMFPIDSHTNRLVMPPRQSVSVSDGKVNKGAHGRQIRSDADFSV